MQLIVHIVSIKENIIELKMEIKTEIDIESLRQWYLFANTPYYLYRHFKEDPGLGDLAQKYKSNHKILLEAFEESLKRDLHVFDNVVEVYALIMVLSFFDTPEVITFFEKLEQYPLQWAKDLNEIYLDSIRAESIVTVRIPVEKPKEQIPQKIEIAESIINIEIK